VGFLLNKPFKNYTMDILNYYKEKEFDEEDFRSLSEVDRKILIQRFIDQVIYDAAKFKVAVKLLERWETSSENLNNK